MRKRGRPRRYPDGSTTFGLRVSLKESETIKAIRERMSRDRGREVTRSKAVRELMRSNLANAEALGRAMERAEQEWKRVPIQSTAALYPPIKVENQGTLIAALLPSTRWANGRTHTIKFDETSVGTYWQPTIIVSIDGVWTFMNNPFIPEEERRRRRDAIRDVPYMQQ